MPPQDEPIFVGPTAGKASEPAARPAAAAETRPAIPVIHTRRDDPPAHSGMSIVLASGAVALLMGGLGAWGYQRFLGPSPTKASPQAAAGRGEQAAANPSAKLDDRVKDLSSRLDELQDRVSHLPKPSATDLEPINQRLTAFEDLPQKLQTLEQRVAALPEKINEEAKKVTTVMADLDGLRTQVSGLRTDIHSESKPPDLAARRDGALERTLGSAAGPRGTTEPSSKGPALEPGITLFQSKKYDEASHYFEDLTKSDAGDARAWYYAALARGLASRDWKGEAEALVNRGVDREKAGSPAKPEIDSAFAALTPETGRDWLAYYRNRARDASPGR
jgi:TolA-binding protein